MDNKELKKDNQRFHEENYQLQNLLTELRNQNAFQKKHIEKILEQLKIAQNEINAMSKVYEDLGQKEMILGKYVSSEKEYKEQIA